MRKIVIDSKTFALSLILICAADAYSQVEPCAVKLVDLPQAPELMGFRPGMTIDQVKRRVPQVVFGPTDEFGSSKTTINPDFDPRIDKSTFPGVRSVSLDFLDGRLISLWIGYDGTFKLQSVDDFVQGISQSLHLPNAWTPWKTRGQQLKCADSQMTVTMIGEGPSFRIVDLSAESTLAARREAKEEQSTSSGDGSGGSQEILGDLHNKTYYLESCRPAKEIDGRDRVIFKTREDAQSAGYKLAKNCQ